MRRILRENGLSIVFVGLFLITLLFGQVLTGLREYNSEQQQHHQPQASLVQYVKTDHFLEATMENWESEFLQMFLFIALTAFLYQKGSAESDSLEGDEPTDRDPKKSKHKKNAPWPVHKGGFILKIYENSLSLAFLILFTISFVFHAVGGAGLYNEDQLAHGSSEHVTALQYLHTSRFWFESFQNWQSEFLSVASMVLLSIWLRQKGSPESKAVDAPHSQTGGG